MEKPLIFKAKNPLTMVKSHVTSLNRSLQLVQAGSVICNCDGTASKVKACLNDTMTMETNQVYPEVSKATRFCAERGLERIEEIIQAEMFTKKRL